MPSTSTVTVEPVRHFSSIIIKFPYHFFLSFFAYHFAMNSYWIALFDITCSLTSLSLLLVYNWYKDCLYCSLSKYINRVVSSKSNNLLQSWLIAEIAVFAAAFSPYSALHSCALSVPFSRVVAKSFISMRKIVNMLGTVASSAPPSMLVSLLFHSPVISSHAVASLLQLKVDND